MIGTEIVLDTYFATKRQVLSKPRTTDYWTASGIGYCLRRQYLDRLSAEVTNAPDHKALRAMAMGDDVHAHVKGAWQRAGMLTAEEVRLVDDELQLSGYLDAIVGGWPRPVDDEPPAVLAGFSSQWLKFLTEYRRRLTERLRLAEAGGDSSAAGNIAIEWKSCKEYSMQAMFSKGPSAHHMLQLAAYSLIANVIPSSSPPQSALGC